MQSCNINAIRQIASTAAHTNAGNSVICGPAVKLLLQQYDINRELVKGSGPKSNLLKSDVLTYIKHKGLKPVPIKFSNVPEVSSAAKTEKKDRTVFVGSRRNVEKFVDIPLTNIRSTIAKRLSMSKQMIPHEYQSIEVKSDAILALRKKLKSDGVVLSLNDFIIKAAGLALRAVPEINVRWNNNQVEYLPTVDISVAVATPTGLITPIVTNADVLGVRNISHKVKELSNRARENKLQPHEFQGGSFTVSNLGMFGSVSNFTAIINPPQAAILTIGGNRTVLNNDLKAESRFTVTLCFDGRAISETSAASFLTHFSAALSDPDVMIAEPFKPELDFDFAKLL
ncbi:unnamed protein product [Auanema sp. JU1783]|nr:unnamed protein product [Auanema sp. JU1783]